MFFPPILTEEKLNVYLVGVGGTGGWLAPPLSKLLYSFSQRLKKKISLTLVDHDEVEEKNIYRQNFKFTQIFRNKAIAMAHEISKGTGIEIKYEKTFEFPNQPFLLISAVDSRKSRREIYNAVKYLRNGVIIDAGNGNNFGQILVGSSYPLEPEKIKTPTDYLPPPYEVFPELIEGEDETPQLSCAQRVDIGIQRISTNFFAASLVLWTVELLLRGELQYAGFRFYETSVSPVTFQEVEKRWFSKASLKKD